MSRHGPFATLLGDLVGSRDVKDRPALQRSVNQTLERINQRLDPVQALEPTVGDEFQGAFRSVATAIRASLLLRLQLLKDREVDSRFGLGFGSVTIFENRAPVSQDGPGWWAARAAIEKAKEDANQGHTAFVRTCLASSDLAKELSHSELMAWNSFLLCRDAIVAQMRPRSRRLLLGLLLGRSQAELAEEEGISQPAVSQNLASSGAYAIEAAEQELKGRVW